VYAWKNEQGNVASEPRFPETSVKSLTNVSLTKVAPKFCKVLEEKKGAWSMRVLPLNSGRIQLPDAKGR
jgi:hypothetical protein